MRTQSAPVPVVLKGSKEVSSASLQSPHDVDATYSGHKGKGYEVKVAETMGNEGKPERITHLEDTLSCESDEAAKGLGQTTEQAAASLKRAAAALLCAFSIPLRYGAPYPEKAASDYSRLRLETAPAKWGLLRGDQTSQFCVWMPLFFSLPRTPLGRVNGEWLKEKGGKE